MRAVFFVPPERHEWAQTVCTRATNDVVKLECVVPRNPQCLLLQVTFTESSLMFVTGFLKLVYSEDSVPNIERFLVYGEYLDATPWQSLWLDPRNIVTAPTAFSTMLDYFDTSKPTTDWLMEVQDALTIAG